MNYLLDLAIGGIVTMIANPLTIGAGYIAARRYDHPVVNVFLVMVLGGLCGLIAVLFVSDSVTSTAMIRDRNAIAVIIWTLAFTALRRRRERLALPSKPLS